MDAFLIELVVHLDRLLKWSRVLGEQLLEYSPRLALALLLLVGGLITSRHVKRLMRYWLESLNRVLDRHWRSGLGAEIRLPNALIGLLGALMYWTLLLLVLIGISRILGMVLFTDWLGQLLDHLPAVLGSGVLLFLGFLISQFVHDLFHSSLQPVMGQSAKAFAGLAQMAVIVIVLDWTLQQAEIDTGLLESLVVIALGGLAFSMALAYGLGARDLVANLIGAHQARRLVEIGQWIRVTGREGRVAGVLSTCIVLETDQGRIYLPGALFQQEAVENLEREEPEHV